MADAALGFREDFSEIDGQLLRDSVRSFLADRWPAKRAVDLSTDANAIAALWHDMADHGFTSLIGEVGLRGTLLVFEELGRAACPAPLAGAVAADMAVALRPGRPDIETLAALHSAKSRIAIAFGAFDGSPDSGRLTLKEEALHGVAAFVDDTASATDILAFTSSPLGIAVVAMDASGMRVTETPGLTTPNLAEIAFDGVSAAFVATDDKTLLSDIALVVRLACAARALGAAERSFELAVEHAKLRRQFGQIIGQFQAIQHKLANCLIDLDGARLSFEAAADAFDRGDANWRAFANAGIAFASPALREVSMQSHQTLGAIGYAEEHEAPRHFRRIHSDLVRMGGVRRARTEIANFVLRTDPAEPDAPSLPAHQMSAAAIAFRQEFRDWLAKNWSPEIQAAYKQSRPFKERGYDKAFSQLMGRDGWIGIGWPKEYGGQARSPSEIAAFIVELGISGAPAQLHSSSESIVARAIMLHGTPEQKAEWLPAIRRGERSFSLGYSEPEAGSDLASLRTTAVRDGDDWVVNGQKLWSNADRTDYAWLAVRTDPDANKHAGISLLIVDLKSPGITMRPSLALYGKPFTAVFYDDVRVPARNMVGPVNEGWRVISEALAEERVWSAGMRMAMVENAFEQLTKYIKGAATDGNPLRDDQVIRDRIGGLAADIEVMRLFYLRSTQMVEQKRTPVHESAVGKVFASELQERLGQAAMDILGSGGLLGEDSPSAPIGKMEQILRHSLMGIMGGGTSEIQRNLIAIRGLGLPR